MTRSFRNPLLLFFAVVLVACGTAADETTTLRVVMADDWAETDAVLDAVRMFERDHAGVEVDVQGLPFSQIPDAVRSATDRGQPFDVAHWHAFAAAAQGLAAPLDDLWDAHLDASSFVTGAVEDVTWAGRRYGMPLDVNAMILATNRDLLEARGVGDIETFAEVRDAATAVRDGPGDLRGIALAHSSWSTYGWIRAAGGELLTIDEDGDARITFDDPATIEALRFLSELVRTDSALPPFSRNQSTDSYTAFREGQTAMHVSGAWDVVALDGANTAWQHGVMPMPKLAGATDPGTALGGSSTFVPAASTNREIAFAFMRHLVTDDNAIRFAREEGRLPARRRVYDEPFFDRRVFRVVRRELERASPMRLIAFPEADRIFSHAIDGILTGRVDAAVAMQRAQERVNEAGLQLSTAQ